MWRWRVSGPERSLVPNLHLEDPSSDTHPPSSPPLFFLSGLQAPSFGWRLERLLHGPSTHMLLETWLLRFWQKRKRLRHDPCRHLKSQVGRCRMYDGPVLRRGLSDNGLVEKSELVDLLRPFGSLSFCTLGSFKQNQTRVGQREALFHSVKGRQGVGVRPFPFEPSKRSTRSKYHFASPYSCAA